MGMNWLRGLGRIGGIGLLLILALPLPAPWVSAAIDRGPDGPARLSALPIALAIFDPFVLECAMHSTIVAGLLAAGSMALGLGLGHLAGLRRTWARTGLVLLAKLPMAAGPLLIAPGVLLVMGGPDGWEWLAARTVLGWSAEDAARWSALVWVGLAWGVPLMMLATESALRRVEPARVDAARAVGATRLRAWRDAVWPVVRPEAARGAATVFTLALVEPAGPMVLGLRRTLAVQILGAANRLDQPTRAATLAILAIAIALLARSAILRWGGPSLLGPGPGPRPRPDPARPRRSLPTLAALAGWSAFAAGPVLALLWRLSGPARESGLDRWPALLAGWSGDPEFRAGAIHAATAAGLAVGLDLLVLAAIAARSRATRLLIRGFEVVPPMALAVGALTIPWALGALADRLGGDLGPSLRALALELSPARSPGFLLIAAIAAGRLPTLVRAADLAGDRARPVLADAGRLMGLSRHRAHRAAQNRWLGIVSIRPVLLSFALASTALAPALLLAPGSERRTLAPAVLNRLLESGTPDPGLLGPVAALLLVNLAGFALASRGRAGPLGDWFRG